MQQEIKTVGASGQISLGKQHAGKTVLVEQPEAGVWIVRTAQVVPDNERWLHTPEAKKILDKALAWADSHPAQETSEPDFAKFVRRTLKVK